MLFLLPSRFSQYLKNIQKTSSIQDFRCSSVNSSQVHTSLYSRMVHLCKPCGQYKANLRWYYNWQSAGWVFGRVQLTIQWDENSQDLLHNLQLPLNGSSFNAVIHRGERRTLIASHSEFMEDIWNLKDLISAHHLRANFWRGSWAFKLSQLLGWNQLTDDSIWQNFWSFSSQLKITVFFFIIWSLIS